LQLQKRAHRKQANLGGQAHKALAKVVHSLAAVQPVAVDVLRLEHPLEIKEV
jgi:hypothetical protein